MLGNASPLVRAPTLQVRCFFLKHPSLFSPCFLLAEGKGKHCHWCSSHSSGNLVSIFLMRVCLPVDWILANSPLLFLTFRRHLVLTWLYLDSPYSEEKGRTREANGILLSFLFGEVLCQWLMVPLKSTVFLVWWTHFHHSLLEQKVMCTCKNFKSIWLEFNVAETLNSFHVSITQIWPKVCFGNFPK